MSIWTALTDLILNGHYCHDLLQPALNHQSAIPHHEPFMKMWQETTILLRWFTVRLRCSQIWLLIYITMNTATAHVYCMENSSWPYAEVRFLGYSFHRPSSAATKWSFSSYYDSVFNMLLHAQCTTTCIHGWTTTELVRWFDVITIYSRLLDGCQDHYSMSCFCLFPFLRTDKV